jgi:membrane protease YdiL (CAAX protease family)
MDSKAVFITMTFFLANFLYFRTATRPISKVALWFIIFIMAWLLASHGMHGFIKWQIINSELISADGEKYSLYMSIDKVIAGIGVLVFGIIPLQREIHIKHMLLSMLPTAVMALAIISSSAMLLGVVNFDPKLPDLWITWIIISLLVNCVAEEAIFRFFLQGKLQDLLKSYSLGVPVSIIISSAAFTYFHSPQSSGYLTSVFIASLFFGYVYRVTKRVEAAILIHYITNFIHFFFFTYPVLNKF